MVTKGVASVRSPVCNIQQSYTNIDHASFAAAVVSEFCKEYNISEEVSLLSSTSKTDFQLISR